MHNDSSHRFIVSSSLSGQAHTESKQTSNILEQTNDGKKKPLPGIGQSRVALQTEKKEIQGHHKRRATTGVSNPDLSDGKPEVARSELEPAESDAL